MRALLSFASLFLVAVAAAAGDDCVDRCVERKRCDSWHEESPTRRRCLERCERLCPQDMIKTEELQLQNHEDAPNEVQLLQTNGTCCQNITNITWPTNATFGDITTVNLTANAITAGKIEVKGVVQSLSTVVKRLYAEDVAASGFVTSDGILVKNQASFRGQIDAKVVAVDQLDATTANIESISGSAVDVTGTLTAGRIEINGDIADLAKEFASLQQRVKDLEEMLLLAEGVKECLMQKD